MHDSETHWEGEAPAEPYPIRKKPTHGVFIHRDNPNIVFITFCTKDRIPFLATSEIHEIIKQAFIEADAWLVGRYVIMPDHIHLFVAPGEKEIPLESWIKFVKSQISKMVKDKTRRWQEGYWDTRLRSGEKYEEKWEYVRNNPVRHGLVEKAEDWQFQGEIYKLPWY